MKHLLIDIAAALITGAFGVAMSVWVSVKLHKYSGESIKHAIKRALIGVTVVATSYLAISGMIPFLGRLVR